MNEGPLPLVNMIAWLFLYLHVYTDRRLPSLGDHLHMHTDRYVLILGDHPRLVETMTDERNQSIGRLEGLNVKKSDFRMYVCMFLRCG